MLKKRSLPRFRWPDKERNERSGRLLRSFMLSFLLVLSLPLIGSFSAQMRNIGLFGEKVEQWRGASLQRSSYALDGKLSAIELFSQNIVNDRHINNLLTAGKPLSMRDQYNAVTAMWTLAGANMSGASPDSFFVCYYRSAIVVTRNGKYTVDHFNLLNQNMQAATENLEYGFRTVEIDGERYLCFKQTVPILETRTPQAELVALVEMDEIEALMMLDSPEEIYCILDGGGSIIAYTGSEKWIGSLSTALAGTETRRQLLGEDVVVSKTELESGRTYLSIVPYSTYGREISQLMKITVIISLVELTAGLLAAFALAYYHYRPVRTIMRFIDNAIAPAKESRGTWGDIADSIKAVTDSNRLLRRNMEELARRAEELENAERLSLTDSLLSDLLLGIHPERVFGQLVENGVSLPHPRYQVLLFQIEHAAPPLADRTISEIKALHNACRMIVQEHVQAGCAAAFCELGRNRFAVLHNAPEAPAAALQSGVILFAREVTAFIRNLQINTHAGIGRIAGAPGEIALSYADARRSLDNLLVLGNGPVAVVWELRGDMSGYYYPHEIEEYLLHQIVLGNLDSCRHLLTHLVDENIQERRLDLRMCRVLFLDIAATLAKACDRSNRGVARAAELVERITQCITLEDMRETLYAVLEEICSETRVQKDSDFINRVLAHIELHYADLDFSAANVAEAVGVSVSHLSRKFKQAVCVGMVEYVNSRRLDEACFLLRETEMPLGRVAESVGFGSMRTFHRLFKEREGITPASYRNKLHG